MAGDVQKEWVQEGWQHKLPRMEIVARMAMSSMGVDPGWLERVSNDFGSPLACQSWLCCVRRGSKDRCLRVYAIQRVLSRVVTYMAHSLGYMEDFYRKNKRRVVENDCGAAMEGGLRAELDGKDDCEGLSAISEQESKHFMDVFLAYAATRNLDSSSTRVSVEIPRILLYVGRWLCEFSVFPIDTALMNCGSNAKYDAAASASSGPGESWSNWFSNLHLFGSTPSEPYRWATHAAAGIPQTSTGAALNRRHWMPVDTIGGHVTVMLLPRDEMRAVFQHAGPTPRSHSACDCFSTPNFWRIRPVLLECTYPVMNHAQGVSTRNACVVDPSGTLPLHTYEFNSWLSTSANQALCLEKDLIYIGSNETMDFSRYLGIIIMFSGEWLLDPDVRCALIKPCWDQSNSDTGDECRRVYCVPMYSFMHLTSLDGALSDTLYDTGPSCSDTLALTHEDWRRVHTARAKRYANHVQDSQNVEDVQHRDRVKPPGSQKRDFSIWNILCHSDRATFGYDNMDTEAFHDVLMGMDEELSASMCRDEWRVSPAMETRQRQWLGSKAYGIASCCPHGFLTLEDVVSRNPAAWCVQSMRFVDTGLGGNTTALAALQVTLSQGPRDPRGLPGCDSRDQDFVILQETMSCQLSCNSQMKKDLARELPHGLCPLCYEVVQVPRESRATSWERIGVIQSSVPFVGTRGTMTQVVVVNRV
jgi:hypothetical protein